MRLLRHVCFVIALGSIATFSFGSAKAQDYVPGEVIIKLKGKASSTSASQFFGKVQGKMALKTSVQGLNIHRFSLKAGADVMATVNEMKADPAVEYAEPNYIIRLSQDSAAPGEAMSYDQAQAVTAQSSSGYTQNYAPVRVQEAWGQEATLAQVPEKPIVAIVDTGIDYNHTVFQQSGAMWVNSGEIPNNGVDDDGNGFIDDVYGWNFVAHTGAPMDDAKHGTHVAGIILGVGQNIFAATLDPAKIRLMALKFLGADGSGATSDAVSAIYYAVNNGAQVINNSWGGASYSQSLHDALTYAYNHKVLIVSAAGNYSKDNDSTPMYPASYPVPGQISVAATNDSDVMASFSNYGATSVHVAAPGVSILSTVPNNSTQFMSGTSMATPFVTGLAALALREAPNLTGYQLKNLLISAADPVSGLYGKISSASRVDAYATITSARGQVSTSAFQPVYKADARAPSSDAAESAGPKGCGLVSTAVLSGAGRGGGDGEGGPGNQTIFVIIAFTLLPLIAWHMVKSRSRGRQQQRRRYDRFLMDSTVKVSVQGRELIGHMRTISEGGLSFEANTMIEKGGIITMNIQSPDGKETVQVQGHVVWSEANKAYGVQFDEARETTRSAIRSWTQRLVKVANY